MNIRIFRRNRVPDTLPMDRCTPTQLRNTRKLAHTLDVHQILSVQAAFDPSDVATEWPRRSRSLVTRKLLFRLFDICFAIVLLVCQTSKLSSTITTWSVSFTLLAIDDIRTNKIPQHHDGNEPRRNHEVVVGSDVEGGKC
jgi:hypothetical protein